MATIGAWSATLIRSLLRDELAGLGIATRDLPDGVRITRRAGRTMLTNFTEAPVALDDGTPLAPVSYRID